jgi:tetratricopeptide (TPR) repeat protein
MAEIALLPDKDSTQDERRKGLMGRLMPLLFETDFEDLAGKCMEAHRYKAAQVFLSKAIEADPENISAREDLAVSYQRAGQFEEAGRIVDDIVTNRSAEMSDYGWHVLLSTRAEVHRNRKDYTAAATDFRKAIEYFPDDDDTNLRLGYLLALARMNNITHFEEGVAFCNKHPTKSYSVRPYDVDALRAYLLVRNHDEAKARAAVEKWRKDPDAQKWFQYYWGDVSDASDVVDTWNRLMK